MEEWAMNCRGRHCRCPVTQTILAHPVVMFSNVALRHSIEEWAAATCPEILGPDGHVRHFEPELSSESENEGQNRGTNRDTEPREPGRVPTGEFASRSGMITSSSQAVRLPSGDNLPDRTLPFPLDYLCCMGAYSSMITSGSMCLALMQFLFFIFGMNNTHWNVEVRTRNPFLGPNITNLVDMGAVHGPTVIDEGSWLRIFTSPMLHAGFFHMIINIGGFLILGYHMEKYHSIISMLPIFLISGTLAGLVSLLLVPGEVCVGASSTFFGLLGAFEVDVVFNHVHEEMSPWQMGAVVVFTVMNLVASLMPNVDMFGSLAAMCAGGLTGLVIFAPSHDNQDACRFWPETQLMAGITLAISVSSIAILLYWKVLGEDWCGACEMISCMDIAVWECQYSYAHKS